MVLLFCHVFMATGQGKVLESLELKSLLLNRTVKYSVYLPPGYETSERRYPVLYLLHGYSDNEMGWIQFGKAPETADAAIASGEVAPMIIVMPDAGLSWYLNSFDGKAPYEDMFFQELIPHIDRYYRTRPVKEFRAIAGLSMGGFGSLVYSLKHAEMFSSCVAFSAAVRTTDDILNPPADRGDIWYAQVYGKADKQTIANHWNQNNVLDLVAVLPADSINRVRLYIDCGDKDYLSKGNAQLQIALIDKKVNYEFRVRAGAHNWPYWRTGLHDALMFVSKSFTR